LDSEVPCLLHRADREIPHRLHHDGSLAARPRDHGRSGIVVMTPAGLTLLAAPTRSASQALLPALFRLAFLASGVVEFIRVNGSLDLALHLIGQGGMAQPPTRAIAGPDMETHLLEMRRDEGAKRNRKVASIQCASDRLPWAKSVCVRSLKGRRQP